MSYPQIRDAKTRRESLNQLAMHIGQAEITALESIGELPVIHSEQVQERGVEIVDVDFVLDGIEAKFIGATIDRARLDAATGHQMVYPCG